MFSTSLAAGSTLTKGNLADRKAKVNQGSYENLCAKTFGVSAAIVRPASERRDRGRWQSAREDHIGGSARAPYPPQELCGGGKLVPGGMFGGILADSDDAVLVTLLKQNPSGAFTAYLARYR